MAWGSQMQKTYYGDNYELFARFGVVDCVLSDNGSQFTSVEFKDFCEIIQIKHITTPQYHSRSNGQAERFVDTLKRAPQIASGTPTDKALQQFLQVYRITPNPNLTSRDDVCQKDKIRLR